VDPLLIQLAALGAHCQTAIGENGPLIGGLFLAGFVGSASHCAGMCGPLVLAQVGARAEESGPVAGLRRLIGFALLPYHLGRGTTYILLGALLAMPVGGLTSVGFHWAAPVALTIAALAFALLGLQSAGLRRGGQDFPWIGGFLGIARPLFARPCGWRGYLLGGVLGFLPCGLLYAAIAAAAATGSPLAAAFGMIGFVLGTMPMLLTIGWIGHASAQRWRGLAQRVMPLIAGLNAIMLLLMAYDLAIGI
jgi:uncharacterized protein